MRKELYRMLCDRLKEVGGGAIKHIDLWNHNVEFIEQEENWERPAVFIEFRPIKWNAIVNGLEYRAEPEVALHVVTDWKGGTSDGSQFQEEGLEVFDLLDEIHAALCCMVRPSRSSTWSRATRTTTTRISWRTSRYIDVWRLNP